MENEHSSSDVLRKEIREQSEAEAAAILEQAEKESRGILDEAKAESEKVKADILRKAEVQAEAVRRRIVSGVHLEIKRQALRTREELLSKIFQAVKERLEGLRKTKAYEPFLKKMIVEGVLALDAELVEVMAGDVEKKHITRQFLSQLEKEVRKQGGKEVKLRLSEQTFPEGGVVLISSDGRMKFDNRFSARMERLEREMRLEAVKKLGIG